MEKTKQAPSALKGKAYWKEAAAQLRNPKMLAVAGIIVALRVAVKALRLPVVAGVSITFDCYINALGSIVYGPLMGLLVGAASDTLGAIIFPQGTYFLPFILTEMLSSFLFGIFLWRKNISVTRTLLAKFTINLVCNIILTSIFQKWYYYFFKLIEKAEAYALVNLVRIVKNLVLFPLESILIVLILQAFVPILKKQGFISGEVQTMKIETKHYLLIFGLLFLSVALVLFYIFFLKDFVSAHNFKLF